VRLLVVEDELALAASLRAGLVAEGFEVEVCHNGKDGLWLATTGQFDAIVLDVMLPGLAGSEVVSRLRGRGVATPVLMLTAVAEDDAVINTLNSGADDYLTKPFSFDMLTAWLRALLRRTVPEQVSRLEVGSLVMNLSTREVTRRGEAVALTPREFLLLETFLRHPDTVLSKQDLLDEVWGDGFDVATNVVEVYVGYLRRKIDVPFDVDSLLTVRGFGYRLTPSD
jgi:two-component system OmpR family response regulator